MLYAIKSKSQNGFYSRCAFVAGTELYSPVPLFVNKRIKLFTLNAAQLELQKITTRTLLQDCYIVAIDVKPLVNKNQS